MEGAAMKEIFSCSRMSNQETKANAPLINIAWNAKYKTIATEGYRPGRLCVEGVRWQVEVEVEIEIK
jgi:hypothetical protein